MCCKLKRPTTPPVRTRIYHDLPFNSDNKYNNRPSRRHRVQLKRRYIMYLCVIYTCIEHTLTPVVVTSKCVNKNMYTLHGWTRLSPSVLYIILVLLYYTYQLVLSLILFINYKIFNCCFILTVLMNANSIVCTHNTTCSITIVYYYFSRIKSNICINIKIEKTRQCITYTIYKICIFIKRA